MNDNDDVFDGNNHHKIDNDDAFHFINDQMNDNYDLLDDNDA